MDLTKPEVVGAIIDVETEVSGSEITHLESVLEVESIGFGISNISI